MRRARASPRPWSPPASSPASSISITASSRKDVDGKTMGEELERIGYAGETACGGRPIAAFFEAHIEQGPILEAENKTIGVVQGVQGIRWYEVTVTGQEAHAGPTPMPRRKDALVGVSRMVECDQPHRPRPSALCLRHRGHAAGLAQFAQCHPRQGLLHHRFPPSRCRGADGHGRGDGQAECEKIAAELGLELDFKEIWYSPPVKFADECVAAVAQGGRGTGLLQPRRSSAAPAMTPSTSPGWHRRG